MLVWCATRCVSRSLRVFRSTIVCRHPGQLVRPSPSHHSVRLAHCGSFPKRTHTCGGLTVDDVGSNVVLAGWILRQRRISNSLSFFTLKDSYGSIQLTLDRRTPEASSLLDELSDIPIESVVSVLGRVQLRPKQAQRKSTPTGEIEVLVENVTLLNAAQQEFMPFLPSEKQTTVNEELRARFRHLDLRHSVLSDNLRKRSQVAHLIRNILHKQDFIEVETPVLLKSTPEGAREFLVPTRIREAGSQRPMFYALPQSPQQPKQLLVCSGAVDKYYQIAKCFRDEDGRKDRQPEFTQIDMEMAFVSWGTNQSKVPEQQLRESNNQWRLGGQEIRVVVESLMQAIWRDVKGHELPSSFPVITYQEAMTRFGSDKPDTRYGLELNELTSLVPTDIQEFCSSNNLAIECLVLRKSEHDQYIDMLKTLPKAELSGIDIVSLSQNNLETWFSAAACVGSSLPHLSDRFSKVVIEALNHKLAMQAGDFICLATRSAVPEGGSTLLGKLRTSLASSLKAKGSNVLSIEPHFLWVTEFPLFTRADDDKEFLAHGRWSSSHHPFTAPMWQDMHNLYSGHVEQVRGQHYDLVLNGSEIGGGSVRIHDATMQEYIFTEVLKLTDSEKASFSHLLHCLRCGAPPHGGIAIGFDRLMAILCDTETIRDVIAFPKTSAGTDPLFKSPSSVVEDVLSQYGIALSSHDS